MILKLSIKIIKSATELFVILVGNVILTYVLVKMYAIVQV